jgi:hypothetical protein
VPARSSGRKVVVTNLRDQPVEVHQGEEVFVIPPFAQAELPDVTRGWDHLPELVRQELVSVERVKPTERKRARRRSTAAAGPRTTTASTRKRKPPKRGS